MPPRKQWVFDPDRGGVSIPEAVQRRTAERIRFNASQRLRKLFGWSSTYRGEL